MRIVVKDLPESTTKEEVEKEFSKHGKITDVFMAKNERGKFRRICFIGYMGEKEGMEAIRYRDGSLFKNQKIRCEALREGAAQTSESEERMIKYSRKIFIRNIPTESDEQLIHDVFKEYGEIEEVGLLDLRERKGAYVKFSKGECALEAYRNVKIIGGMKARMFPWKDKAEKGRYEHYNTLFFNFESIVKRICESERIGIKELVDVNDKDLGTRMALIETHLVQETKEFLENNGIYLDNLTGDTDKKTLIIRNMELMKCLDLIDSRCKISIAPSKCLALLKFEEEEEARKCYRKLNLKRMKEQVIYCEYAPMCNVSKSTREEMPEDKPRKGQPINKLLIRNVPFQASEEEIRRMFNSFHVVDVRIPVKREGTSRGFCFVTLGSPDEVTAAIKHFGSSTHLYGRRLVLEKAKS
ncbi:RNA binding domain-containing protein [Encephalitozoon hellem ATCC 50504]|uniref:RRM domain-containing protein n=1 Tax=Encephalitozoon hellem TaxID=27973 RepID=A0A9Q9C4W0_ENCHE|nr:RNA binding domain-containing protein [Encephalitozoon hellem ATCC 50504]AFM98749.1 RNA binding domain-containing protein [Encephalitozoon hellem ATCC 50504]UTX43725.1 RRM domain-containing protein [Encephalitozoon hellem]WEL39202.1 RRM domain-containing protein [Encephalitozoon hellem]|eukprot:XP_003887730.1 RNA binding domain-containing protein [Encephalitozoon hellem ATCC 50504]